MDLPDLIRGVNHRLEQALEAQLKPRGMSLHHYRLLETLADRNGQPMGDLASRLLIDGPTLTKIVNRMVASAEVYRGPDPHDRRKVLIFLSRRARHASATSASSASLFSRLSSAGWARRKPRP